MAAKIGWIRQLDSGLWANTIRTPVGRLTESFPLQKQAEAWGRDQLASIARGDWIDPRLGEMTVGDWRERCQDSRRLELASRKRDESHWRCHVEPAWARVPLAGILQPDVSKWVIKMERAGHGPDTITGSVKVLRGLLQQAVAAKRIHFNPARGVSLPKAGQSPFRVLEPHEDRIVLDALATRFPGRPEAALFVELLLDTGMRWEECAGLHRRNVDLKRKRIHVIDVMERNRTTRPYPKSTAGERDLPIGDDLWPRLRELAMTRQSDDLMFTTKLGKPLDYTRWRSRVWVPIFEVPVRFGGYHNREIVEKGALLDGAVPTPHDMRHTVATRLAEQGMMLHELMAILGQKDVRAAQRYLHAGESRFDRTRKALDAARKAPRAAGDS